MLWLDSLESFAPDQWNGEPVVWISQSGAQTSPELRKQARRDQLRKLSSRLTGVSPNRLQMERRASGQACISGPELLWLSSASRGSWNAVAIARAPIGVDIETCPAAIPVPFNLLHPLERDSLQKLEGRARQHAFLQFWTAREAYWKAAGRGLDAPLSCSRAEMGEGQIVRIIVNGNRAGEAQTVISDEYVAAAIQMGEE